MFAPQTQNEIPNILMRGAAAQTEMTTQGANQRANMISSAVQNASSSAGSAIGGAVSQWKKTAAQADKNAGVLQAYNSLNQQSVQNSGKPIVPQEYLDSIAGEKNQDKISGSLMAISPVVESSISQQRQIAVLDAQSNAAANLAVYKESVATPKEATTFKGQNAFYQLQNGQLVQLKSPDGTVPQPQQPAGMFSGIPGVDPQTGAPIQQGSPSPTPNPASPIPGQQPSAGAGVVTTRAQFDALPSGATYTGANGKKYKKP